MFALRNFKICGNLRGWQFKGHSTVKRCRVLHNNVYLDEEDSFQFRFILCVSKWAPNIGVFKSSSLVSEIWLTRRYILTVPFFRFSRFIVRLWVKKGNRGKKKYVFVCKRGSWFSGVPIGYWSIDLDWSWFSLCLSESICLSSLKSPAASRILENSMQNAWTSIRQLLLLMSNNELFISARRKTQTKRTRRPCWERS